MTEEKEDANKHIKQFVDYYVKLPEKPYYALMISGKWGCGKSHMIKGVLNAIKPPVKYLYLSLYGLTSKEDIDNAIISKLYPMAKSFNAAANTLAQVVLKQKTNFKVEGLLKKSGGVTLFVFDDFERCKMPPDQTLGYINNFVEFDGAKVIIIAADDKIKDEAYKETREKVVGRIFEVTASFKEAFDYFLASHQDRSIKQFFSEHASDIQQVFEQSGLNNLRLLKQVMADFERLFHAIPMEFKKNTEAMLTIMRLFFAMSFEYKTGNLKKDDFYDRLNNLVKVRVSKDSKETRLSAAGKKYQNLSFDNSILSDDLLVNIITKGFVDEGQIRSTLEGSPHFASNEVPDWRLVWYGMEIEESAFLEATKRMEEQFKKREFLDCGEILHVCALRLWLAKIGIIEKPIGEIVSECKKYIDDLRQNNQLEKFDKGYERYGAQNLGFHGRDEKEFVELLNYYKKQSIQIEEDSMPKRAQELLGRMRESSDLCYGELCFTRDGSGEFCTLPIFSYIRPAQFVKFVLSLNPKKQREIFSIFRARYETGALQNQLAKELPWLKLVKDEFVKALPGLSKIANYRIKNDMSWGIEQFIKAN